MSSRANRKPLARSMRTGCHSAALVFPGTASARAVPASSAVRSRVQQDSPTLMMTAFVITLTSAVSGSSAAGHAPSSGPRTSRPSAGRGTAASMTGTVIMAPIPARAAPAAAIAPR